MTSIGMEKTLQNNVRPLNFILAYMGVGRLGRSLGWYIRAARERNFLVYWLNILPCFEPLTKHPRFDDVFKLVQSMDGAS